MSDDEEGGALVPIKEETVEFTAGLLGATAGLFIGGPVFAFILGAAANYVSKMEGDASEVVQAVSKSSIQIFNYLTRLDKKYEILDKTKDKLEEAVDGLKAKGTVDPDALAKVEGALETTKSKIEEINDEYDLVGAGMTALGVVGDLVEKAVKKASELNEEYQLSGKALDALKTSVDKAKDAAKEAQSKL
jgi:chromosome segregation ATPase